MRRENLGRDFLVTKFKCAECGSNLQLSYEKRNEPKYLDDCRDGITGANKVEQNIFIEPCHKCVDEVLKDMEDLKGIFGKYNIGKKVQ